MTLISDILSTLSAEKRGHFLRMIADATNETIEGIIISDATQPDNPIIYANAGFEKLTGYSRQEVLGKNCRFLQGEETDAQTVLEIRQAVDNGRECRVDILNYRKDGSRFWNRLSITPLRDKDGKVVNFIGVQFDVTELKDTRLRLEKANVILQQYQKEMEAELEQARRAQEAILPLSLPQSPKIETAVKFVPLSQIGGDFYDIIKLSDSSYGFLIADVTGHGIPAALLTFMSATAFKNSSVGQFSTSEVIAETNKRIYQKMPGGTFASMFYMIYNIETNELTYTQAGHPPAFRIIESSGKVELLQTSGALVGIFPDEHVNFDEKTIELNPGDKIIMYTDAILESVSRKFVDHDINMLKSMVQKHRHESIGVLLETIYAYGLEFLEDDHYYDDATILGLKVVR